MARKKENWIADAIQDKGAFTRKAKRAGKTVDEFADEVLREGSGASTKTKRQANLAKTLKRLRKSKKTDTK